MYAIEINLLKERTEDRVTSTRRTQTAADSRGPLFLGIAVGCSCLGLAVASLLVLNLLNQQLTAQEQELDEQLAELAPELAQVERMKSEEQRLQAETKALAGIFNQVKPWSATLQDIRDRVPPGLQITCIQQASGAAQATSGSGSASSFACASSSSNSAPAPSPSSSPSPAPGPAPVPAQSTGDLTIKGNALSFSDISDFVLALQNSAFLNGDVTQLIQAQRQSNEQTSSQTNNTPGGPLLVEYQIQTGLSDVPASELLQELNRKGAAGLATRIGTLKEKGVLQR